MAMRGALLGALLGVSSAAWKLRWADEFDGNTLNTALWTPP